jgi:hypothetical protein
MNQTARRLARSHAVKQALENKRKLQRESRYNFRITTSKDKPKWLMSNRAHTRAPATSLYSLSAGALDPFQTLAVDSSRLMTPLGDCKLLPVAEICLGRPYIRMVQPKPSRLLNQSSVLRKSLHFRTFVRFSELV